MIHGFDLLYRVKRNRGSRGNGGKRGQVVHVIHAFDLAPQKQCFRLVVLIKCICLHVLNHTKSTSEQKMSQAKKSNVWGEGNRTNSASSIPWKRWKRWKQWNPFHRFHRFHCFHRIDLHLGLGRFRGKSGISGNGGTSSNISTVSTESSGDIRPIFVKV